MSFLSNLEWRFATKLFDTNKIVSDQDLQIILDSIRMTPTSFGLQPYHVQIITDQSEKDEIQKLSWNQPQIGTCSHLLVFLARTDVEQRIGDYARIASAGDDSIKEKLKGYLDMMKGALVGKPEEEILLWAVSQANIALGFAMAACAELRIDSCAMGGFDAAKLDVLLDLPEDLSSVVMLPIGYRTEDPKREKVRFGEEDLFTI
jgi:nitroreductase